MGHCCEAKTEELAALRIRQGRILWIVLAVNLVMFCLEFGAGYLASSTALLGDSLDMLGDTFVYAFSLYVINKSAVWAEQSCPQQGPRHAHLRDRGSLGGRAQAARRWASWGIYHGWSRSARARGKYLLFRLTLTSPRGRPQPALDVAVFP